MKRALTIVELLVCIAIVLLLAALILPVSSAALERARLTSEMSQLKQIGVAASLYEIDNDQKMLVHLDRLVESKRVAHTVLASRLDPFEAGVVNEAIKSGDWSFPYRGLELPPYRRSVLDPHMVTGPIVWSFAKQSGTGGRAVLFTNLQREKDPMIRESASRAMIRSAFLRLTFQGSVFHRPAIGDGAESSKWIIDETNVDWSNVPMDPNVP
ncbi:MAG: hypothetical protein MUC92_07900 [Fimbriimonadaceae bacterium]|jgi:competence protein ComGC|nr:hypothetical protein [Fimbriimonadaceae bacterium]